MKKIAKISRFLFILFSVAGGVFIGLPEARAAAGTKLNFY
jgi:hypothetical protein